MTIRQQQSAIGYTVRSGPTCLDRAERTRTKLRAEAELLRDLGDDGNALLMAILAEDLPIASLERLAL